MVCSELNYAGVQFHRHIQQWIVGDNVRGEWKQATVAERLDCLIRLPYDQRQEVLSGWRLSAISGALIHVLDSAICPLALELTNLPTFRELSLTAIATWKKHAVGSDVGLYKTLLIHY
jgi:hypothetical protein